MIEQIEQLVRAAGVNAEVRSWGGTFSIEDIEIESDTATRRTIARREVEERVWIVTRSVATLGDRDTPPDVDVIEIARVGTLASAVAIALAEVVAERIAAHEQRQGEDELAEEFAGHECQGSDCLCAG